MSDLRKLMIRDSVTCHWFWVSSINAGPYAENEKFDGTFVRDTPMVVGSGYFERRTFHISGVTTAQVDSRREHSGEIIEPDTAAVLAHVITDAHTAAQYEDLREWADGQRNTGGTYRDALADFEDWNTFHERHRILVTWLGDQYDEYVKAAEEYVAEY